MGILKNKVAISVFNRWIGRDDLQLLDCKSHEEREERNARMLCFWESIYESTDVYTYRSTSQQPASQEITFMRYLNKASYLNDCAYSSEKTSNQFQFVVILEFQAIYSENWDDTNILWYVSRKKLNHF